MLVVPVKQQYVVRTPSTVGTLTEKFTDLERVAEYVNFHLNHPSAAGEVHIKREPVPLFWRDTETYGPPVPPRLYNIEADLDEILFGSGAPNGD